MTSLQVTKNNTSFLVSQDQEARWRDKFPRWEPNTFRVMDDYLDPDGTYLDIGCWIGPTLLYASRKCKKTIGIEADPVAFATCEKNVNLNGFDNITLVNKAISDNDGTEIFGGNGELGNSQSTLLVRDNEWIEEGGEDKWSKGSKSKSFRDTEKVVVDSVTIETLVKEGIIDDCSFVKMDIEGGEKIVVPALMSFLKEKRPIMYISLHLCWIKKYDVDNILKMLEEIYDFSFLKNRETGQRRIMTREEIMSLPDQKAPNILCIPKKASEK